MNKIESISIDNNNTIIKKGKKEEKRHATPWLK